MSPVEEWAVVEHQADATHSLSSDVIRQIIARHEMGPCVESQNNSDGERIVYRNGLSSLRTRHEIPHQVEKFTEVCT